MDNFLTVARQVWMLFALIGVGALCRRMRLVDEAASRVFVNVLFYVVTPCLIVHVFQRPFDAAMMRQLGLAFAVAAFAHVLAIALARLTVRSRDAGAAPVLKLATAFSNAGFMGIPLEQAVLGDRGVFFGIVYVAVFNLFIWSWGLRVMRGGERVPALRSMVANPGTIGLAAGLPFFLLSVRLPEALAEPVSMVAGMNTPLAMIVIGYYLAGSNVFKALCAPGALTASAARLVVHPLLLVAALWPLRSQLDREMMLALVTASSAPVAAMVAMFAAKCHRDVELGVGLISGTTLASIVTMPAVIALAMAVLGGEPHG